MSLKGSELITWKNMSLCFVALILGKGQSPGKLHYLGSHLNMVICVLSI